MPDGELPFAKVVESGVRIEAHLQPGAKRSGFSGLYGERVKIAVMSPPVDGKANEAAVAFLAKSLKRPRSMVELVSGATSRHKVFLVRSDDPDAVMKKLKELV
ncbi:MAG: DUF167 domain-containing protein [Victivallaceae bacterium]|nr:DUF167 domain-containing protein [Victivallaceae bacterium]